MANVYEILIPELRDDPLARGYAGMTDAERLASLTAPTRSKLGTMRLGVFNQFLMGAGLLKGIRAGQDHADPTIASICIGLMLQFQGNADRQVDPSDPDTIAMIDALIAAGIVINAHKTAFLAACSVPCSRADELGLSNLGIGHMASAREQIGG